MKAAAAGKSSGPATTCLAPPRPKLTTAAAETGKANRKGKLKQQTRSTSEARKLTTATAAAAASVLSVQRDPPETLKKSNIPLDNVPYRAPIVSTKRSPPERTKTMLRHQQMTSLGVQTIQLLCIPPQKSQEQSHATVEDQQQQNQVPISIEKKDSSEEHLPCTVQKEAATSTKPIASPRRHAQPAAHEVAKPKIKQRLKGTFYGSAQPPAARHRIRTVDDESDSDLDSFIETDDEEEEEEESGGASSGEHEEENNKVKGEIEGQVVVNNADTANMNTITRDRTKQQHVHTSDGGLSKRLNAKRNKPKKWKMALKEALNGYDASKYADVDAKPDRRMHASFEEILAEEARAGEIGRHIDRLEAEKEIAARALEKKSRQKQRRQHPFVVLEDDTSSSRSGDDVLSDSGDEEEDSGVENRVRKRRKKLAGFLASF